MLLKPYKNVHILYGGVVGVLLLHLRTECAGFYSKALYNEATQRRQETREVPGKTEAVQKEESINLFPDLLRPKKDVSATHNSSSINLDDIFFFDKICRILSV